MKYQLAKTSRLGNRVVNEDRIGVAESGQATLLVLADGMGGYRGGQLASKTLVNSMLAQFKQGKFPVPDPAAFLKVLIADAHLAVIRAGSEQYPPIEPRTTCVVCLLQDGDACWAHVGDSRLYLFRDGSTLSRTVDHSKIEELRRKRKLSEQELQKHPQRHLVTRCIGYQQIPPIPAISDNISLEKDDVVLLCSDGLWGPLDERMISENLLQHTLAQAVDRLAYQAEFRSYPEADNISLIALRWISADSASEQQEQAEPDELMLTLDALDRAVNKFDRSG